jgi:hypothetical protein
MNRHNSLNETDISILNMLHNMYTSNNNTVDRILSSNNEILGIIQQIINNNYDSGLSERSNRFTSNRNNISIPISRQNTNHLSNILFSFPDNNRSSFILDYMEPRNNEIEQILENFLNPVPIQVTQRQIEISTSQIPFREISEPINNSCPISLEPFQENELVTMIKYCGHVFKTNQINQWFETNVRCPVCRYDVRNYREQNNSVFAEDTIRTTSRGSRSGTRTTSSTSSSNRRNIPNRNIVRNDNIVNQIVNSILENTNTDISNNSL